MGKERMPIRVDPETKDALSDYAGDRDISKSEAGRRAIRSFLSKHGYEIAAADGMGVGQLDQLAEQLDSIEQRQAARADQRERLDVAQNVYLVAGLSYVVATVGLGAGGILWTAVGVISVVGIVAATLWTHRLEADE